MSDKKRVALLTAYNKDQSLLDLATILTANNWELIGSKGTVDYLLEHNVAIKDISEIVGGGPILGHKVATLSREIMSGLLANKDDPQDMKDLDDLNAPFIDLVYVDLYPLKKEIENKEATPESVLKNTDIGGPALLRAAAKGGRYIIYKPGDIKDFCFWFGLGEPNPKFMIQFMRTTTECFVSEYSAISSGYWADQLPTYRTLLSMVK